MLNVPKSSYYRWLNSSEQVEEHLDLIKSLVIEHKYRYGYRRLNSVLRTKHNIKINHKKLLRIMNENNLLSKVRKKSFKLLNGNKHKRLDDLINRDFKAESINTKWYTDITMIKSKEARLYLSVIIDGYNNEVVAHSISERPDVSLVLDTIDKACNKSQYDELILHSDQGSTYTAYAFQKKVKEMPPVQYREHFNN